jgi:lipid-binding SYLF domain-containing protein
MSYATTNPPRLMGQVGGGGARMWYYASTDVHTDVDAANYFSNGDALGMEVDDLVFVVKTSTTVGATLHSVSAVTAGGAATITPAILA